MNETTLESSPNYTRNLIISVLISLLITPIVKLILINAVPSLKLRTLESITLYIAITAIILIVLSLRKGKKYKLTQTSIIDSKTTVTYKEISSIKLKKSKISIPQDIGTISIYKKNGNPIKPTIILKNIENAEKIYNKLIQEIVDTKESNEIIYKTKPIPRYWQANGETILQIIRITVIAILISLPSVYLPQILNWTLNLNMTTLNIKRIMDSPTKNTLPPMVYFELLLILSVILIILYIKERKLKKTEYILRKGYIEIIQKSISITRKIWPYQNFIETEIKNKRLKQKQIGTIHIL
ncbi:MAG: PH domain-containing protein, partial [Nitrospiraceae bacterium]|nr:PH domain-containing protein [Nitrospiraceae bacterium]